MNFLWYCDVDPDRLFVEDSLEFLEDMLINSLSHSAHQRQQEKLPLPKLQS